MSWAGTYGPRSPARRRCIVRAISGAGALIQPIRSPPHPTLLNDPTLATTAWRHRSASSGRTRPLNVRSASAESSTTTASWRSRIEARSRSRLRVANPVTARDLLQERA